MDDLLTEQQAYLQDFWKRSDVVIENDQLFQEGIRFNLYQLLQSAGRDGHSNISAKGLSGEGYEGHYFWDTEIYMLPVFLMTSPERARQLLLYRYSKLEQARNRAKEMGHTRGALFPWRTIAGTECSSFFPSGTAQYHISADVAYSYIQYYLAEEDQEFLLNYGAEVLFETARLDLDNTHGNTKDGLHMANMGGTWMAIVFGFAGMRLKESGLSLSPAIPDGWTKYAFRLTFRRRLIAVTIDRKDVVLELLEGSALTLTLYGQPVELSPGATVRQTLIP